MHISIVTWPDWATPPMAAEIARLYPAAAKKLKLSGRAVMDCKVTELGELVSCRIEDENPRGADFGAAAIQISKVLKMRPMTADGMPVDGGPLRVTVSFSCTSGARAQTCRSVTPSISLSIPPRSSN